MCKNGSTALLGAQGRDWEAGNGSTERTVESSGQAKICTEVHKALKLSTRFSNF